MVNELWNGLRFHPLTALRAVVLSGMLVWCAGTVQAQNMTERLPPGSYLSTQGIPGSECMCRANGTFYNEGERTCLRTATGRRLALCNKVLNVLNWALSDNPCPES